MTIAQVSERYGLTQDTLRYYERVGMIPPVKRTAGGIRDYGEEDCAWVELARCMRGAGLPVEAMIEYVKLTRQGDQTIAARRQLLLDQRAQLRAQKAAIERMAERLDYKIARYDEAMRTGTLTWGEETDKCN